MRFFRNRTNFFGFLQSTHQTGRFEPNFLQTKNESSEDTNPLELEKNLKTIENPEMHGSCIKEVKNTYYNINAGV